MSRSDRKKYDPYASIRRDVPPSGYAHIPKSTYTRKDRRREKYLIEKEIKELIKEDAEMV